MTIPTLIANYQEKQTVSQLTKAYTTLSNAFQMAQVEYGPINTWGLKPNTDGTNPDGSLIYVHTSQKLFAERLKKYLKVAKTCEEGKQCTTFDYYYLGGGYASGPLVLDGSTAIPPEGAFYLNDGTFVALATFEDEYGELNVVLPGVKHATLGKNKFYFFFNSKGLFPKGMKGDEIWPFEDFCVPGSSPWVGGDGQGCTAWVIYNKNLDYTKCRDKLSWDGAHSCEDAE